MKNEIEDLKAVVDQLTLQVAWLTANQNVLKRMVIGVYQDTLPKEQSEPIIAKFYSELEKEHADKLNILSELLFDQTSRSIRREKFDSFCYFRHQNDDNANT